jgi:hypothetical protein
MMPKFVKQCRQLLPECDQDQSFNMIADGEALQIQPYDCDDVAAIVEECKINIGKGPASCTNTIGNACDRSNLLKAAKKTLKSVTTLTEVDFQDPVLENRIFKEIEHHNRQLSADKRTNICKGLIKIARSLARVVNFQVVSHGFHGTLKYIRSTPKGVLRTWIRLHWYNLVRRKSILLSGRCLSS